MGWWGRLETTFSNTLSRTWETKPLFKSDSSFNYHSSLLHTSFVQFHSKLLIVNVINHFAEKGNVTWGIKWSNLQIDLCLAGCLACGLSRICLWVILAKHAPLSLPHWEYIFLGAEYILNTKTSFQYVFPWLPFTKSFWILVFSKINTPFMPHFSCHMALSILFPRETYKHGVNSGTWNLPAFFNTLTLPHIHTLLLLLILG